MKTTKFIQVGMLLGILTSLLGSSSSLHASVIAGLASDGTVYTADTTNFAGTNVTLATLPTSLFTYVDMTYGNGLLYGLRSDGAVYSVNLSGTTSLVFTTGWTSAVTKIDFANGTLFGLVPGANTTVINAAGAQQLRVTSFTAGDFGIRDNGDISLLKSATNAWMYTFANGYNGGTSGFVTNGFTNFGGNPIALDVNGQLAATLQLNTSTTFVESRYQNGLTGTVTFDSNRTFGVSLALSDDNTTMFYVASDLTVRTSPIALNTGAATLLGDFGAGTGVGIAVVPEPATWGLLALGLTTVVVFRRRKTASVD